MTRPRKPPTDQKKKKRLEPNPGSCDVEADALTTRPNEAGEEERSPRRREVNVRVYIEVVWVVSPVVVVIWGWGGGGEGRG